MADNTKIEWASATWNPATGCTEISPGCAHCYAKTMAKRLKLMGNRRYVNGFEVTLHRDQLELPLSWKKPRMVFVNSMSDLFHEDVPFEFIESVFGTIKRAHWHTFQVLTKRSERLRELAPKLEWPENLWMGVTVECQSCAGRADDLKATPAAVKFISAEPLIGPVSLDLDGLDWIIAGGESGPQARPVDPEWIRSLRDDCIRTGTPFFFKQWGGVNKKKAGRVLDEEVWSQFPKVKGAGQKVLMEE